MIQCCWNEIIFERKARSKDFKVNQKYWYIRGCFKYEVKLLKSHTKFTYMISVCSQFFSGEDRACWFMFFWDKLMHYWRASWFSHFMQIREILEICFFRHRYDAKRRRSYRHIVQLKRYNGWNANYRCDLLARKNSWPRSKMKRETQKRLGRLAIPSEHVFEIYRWNLLEFYFLFIWANRHMAKTNNAIQYSSSWFYLQNI